MKKKKTITVITIALLLVIFAFFCSDVGRGYFSDYGKNFKKNVSSLMYMFNINPPQSWKEFLEDVPEEQPLTEYDIIKQEYERQQQEIKDEANKQKEIDNTEYNSTNISGSGKNIAFENAVMGRYARYNGGILSVTESSVTFYSETGDRKWSADIQISSPVLEVAGNFILVFEKNGKKFTLYNADKKIYTKNAEGTIKTGGVSSSGDAVIVFERDNYKGSVSVYNKSGEEVYLWNSGKYSILDADISASRRLAVSLLSTDEGVSSKIYFFDIGKSDVDSSTDLEDSIAFDIVFDGDVLNAFTDNSIAGISSKADVKWKYNSENKNITRYSMTSGGTKVVAFDNKNVSEIALISAGGAEKGNIKTEVLPDVLDISNDRILYNDGRTLILTNLSGEILYKYTCSRDIKKAYIINQNNIFIVYNSSIEFLNVKGA